MRKIQTHFTFYCTFKHYVIQEKNDEVKRMTNHQMHLTSNIFFWILLKIYNCLEQWIHVELEEFKWVEYDDKCKIEDFKYHERRFFWFMKKVGSQMWNVLRCIIYTEWKTSSLNDNLFTIDLEIYLKYFHKEQAL